MPVTVFLLKISVSLKINRVINGRPGYVKRQLSLTLIKASYCEALHCKIGGADSEAESEPGALPWGFRSGRPSVEQPLA